MIIQHFLHLDGRVFIVDERLLHLFRDKKSTNSNISANLLASVPKTLPKLVTLFTEILSIPFEKGYTLGISETENRWLFFLCPCKPCDAGKIIHLKIMPEDLKKPKVYEQNKRVKGPYSLDGLELKDEIVIDRFISITRAGR